MDRKEVERIVKELRRKQKRRRQIRFEQIKEDGGPGSGNWGHSGRPGEVGGSSAQGSEVAAARRMTVKAAREKSAEALKALHKTFQKNKDTWENCRRAVKSGSRIPSATSAREDHTIPGVDKKTQAAYDKARANEQEITRDLVSISDKTGAWMYGLDFSVKTGKSVASKIARKKEAAKAKGKPIPTDEEIVSGLGDLVRYTQMCDHDSIGTTAKKTLTALKEKGYTINEVDNKWTDETSYYKGFHINATSPNGQKIELQIHSPESMEVKEQLHPMFEVSREVDTERSAARQLVAYQKGLSRTLKMPKGIDDEELKSWKG